MKRAIALCSAAVLAAGCAGGSPAPAAAECEPPTGELSPALRAASLAGEYRLTLVASEGPRAGTAAAGTLRLLAYGNTPPPLPAGAGVEHAVHGSADVAISRVGAVAPGAVDAADPAAPGVLAVEWPRPGGPYGAFAIAFRLGADGNREDRVRFDGSSLALFVAAADADGFGGRWESGAGTPVAAGYFCALRVGERPART
jgi:hypothetical protein